jgi:hypothetical protein
LSNLASEIIQFSLAPALQKKFLIEPELPFLRYFGCYEQVFESGAVLGHAFRKDFVWFVQFFSQPGKQQTLARGLAEMAAAHLKKLGEATTFFDLAMHYEESRIRQTWKDAGKTEAQIEDRLNHYVLTPKQAITELNLGLNLGLGIGGTYPELVEQLWRETYERPIGERSVELLRRAGMPPPRTMSQVIPLRRQEEYLLSGVRTFVKVNHPELIVQLEAIVR